MFLDSGQTDADTESQVSNINTQQSSTPLIVNTQKFSTTLIVVIVVIIILLIIGIFIGLYCARKNKKCCFAPSFQNRKLGNVDNVNITSEYQMTTQSPNNGKGVDELLLPMTKYR